MERQVRASVKAQQEHRRRLAHSGHSGAHNIMSVCSYIRCKSQSHFGVGSSCVSFSQATQQSVTKAKIQKKLERKMVDRTFGVLDGLVLGSDATFCSRSGSTEPPLCLSPRDVSPLNDGNTISRAMSDLGLHAVEQVDSDTSVDPGCTSLFCRPGMGTVVFRRNLWIGTRVLGSVRPGPGKLLWRSPSMDGLLLERKLREAPWCGCEQSLEEDIDGQSDEDDPSPLEAFLAAWGASKFLPVFQGEKINLPVLMLCSDHDLLGIHIPLGPRRKILEGCRRRREALKTRGDLRDTQL